MLKSLNRTFSNAISSLVVLVLCSSAARAGQAQGKSPATPTFVFSCTLAGHADLVDSVAFSPDGRYLASGSGDNTVKLWDFSTGKVLQTLNGPGELYTPGSRTVGVFSVAFSSDGHYLASGGLSNIVSLWLVPSGEIVGVKTGGSAGWTLSRQTELVSSVAFSPDGRYLAAGGGKKNVWLVEFGSGSDVRQLKGHRHLVRAIAFSPDSHFLVSGSWDKTIKVWDVATGKVVQKLEGHLGLVDAVSFSRDGRYLASGDGNDVRLWDVATWKAIRHMTAHTERVRSVAFSPDGRSLASASNDGTIRLWDVTSGQPQGILKPSERAITSVAFSPDGLYLVAGSSKGLVLIWRRNE